MRHCLACEVSGAPSGCVWSVRGTVCLGLCKWVSMRLWGVRVCVSACMSRGLSQEYVFVSLLRSVSGAGCLSRGSGDRLCPGVWNQGSRWWVWPSGGSRVCVSLCECLSPTYL